MRDVSALILLAEGVRERSWVDSCLRFSLPFWVYGFARLAEELAAPSVDGIRLSCRGLCRTVPDRERVLVLADTVLNVGVNVRILASSACEVPHPKTCILCLALCEARL